MERSGGANLLTPPSEEKIDDGEEQGEESGIGEVKRERQNIRRLGSIVVFHHHLNLDGGVRGGEFLQGRRPAAAGVHCWKQKQ